MNTALHGVLKQSMGASIEKTQSVEQPAFDESSLMKSVMSQALIDIEGRGMMAQPSTHFLQRVSPAI